MRIPRFGLALSMMAALPLAALAQAPKAEPAKPGADRPAAAKPAKPPKADEVLATVNGDKITRLDVLQFLSNFPRTPGEDQLHYEIAVNQLINTKLITQFLKQQKVSVAKEEIDQAITQQEEKLRKSNSSLAAVLADSNTSMDELRARIGESLQWRNYLKTRASDSELRKYADRHRDVFNGTLVRASHIQINLPEKAADADVAKAKQKLETIKKEIEDGKIQFADAANKYSEAEDNVAQPSGGDVDWFPRRRLSEPFAAAAFKLKKGEISDPVRTEYGLHLIEVTDRRDGADFQFERIKSRIEEVFAEDLQKDIVVKMRDDPATKITINPMPADLFPKIPTAADAAKPAEAKKE